ncbi:MAG TPA: Gfo/Idh/MocA family oxidoreductase [Gemmatimonadales bacterium]|nr:Gfo/Idh/MocA family oxidoreductase [Gemmatimonadales bacterium]
MTERLRVGLIGAGAIAQVAHLPTLRRMKDVEVAVVCDSDLPKARAVANRFKINDAFDDIDDVLRYEELDALVISTPNHLHESHAISALSAGLHVLVEKPLATSTKGVNRVIRQAKKSDRILMVGTNQRYRPDVETVRGFVESGELGKVDSVRGSWHVFRPSRLQLGWRMRQELAGGGAMLDLGLAVLDIGLWLAGNPVPTRVSAVLNRLSERSVEHAGSAFVVCENGASIFLDVTWNHIGDGERFGAGVRGSKGTASINPFVVWKQMHGAPVNVSPTTSWGRETPYQASFRAEWAHFLAAIRGRAKAPPLEDQVTLHQVLDAIYQSAEENRDIKL